MKKKRLILFGSLCSVVLMVLAAFPSVVGYQSRVTAIQEHTRSLLDSRLPSTNWTPGSILLKVLMKVLVGLFLFEVGYQLYWMIQEAEPFTIEWFLVLPYIFLMYVFSALVYLALGIVMLPWLILSLLFVEMVHP